MLDLFHQGLRWTHIVVGFVGLVVFWAPIFLKKGGGNHIRLGRIFVWCARIVGFSALFSCVWALASPTSFLGPSADPATAGRIGFFFAILGVLSLALLTAVFTGVDAPRYRKTPARLDSLKLASLHALQGFASLALAANGALNLAADGSSLYWIHVVLGALMFFDAIDAHRYVKNPLPTPMAWWYRHMESMIGGGIAFHTAFAVFGFGRFFGFEIFQGTLGFVPWILPSAIGVPGSMIWIRRYKRKFGELQPIGEAGGVARTSPERFPG